MVYVKPKLEGRCSVNMCWGLLMDVHQNAVSGQCLLPLHKVELRCGWWKVRFCHNTTMWCRVHVSCMLCLYIIFPSLMLHANTIMPTIPHPQYAKEVGGLRPYPTMKGFGFQCSWPLHMCTKYFNHYRWDNVHKLECDLRGIIPLRAILTSRSYIQFVWDG